MRALVKTGFVIGAITALSACSVVRDSVRNDVRDTQKLSESTPTRNITTFAPALRCMDMMLVDYGKRDLKIIVEDLEDRTGDVKAGTKDMLITAISDMTKRSRAISLVAYGNDSGNLVAFLNAAGQQGAFKDVPEFDIRGSITQFDKDVISKGADTGGSVDVPGGVLGGGFGGSAKGSVLGLDLSMLRTSDLTLIPGVTSRNSIVIVNSGFGGDLDATIKKAGVNFNFSVSRSEGRSQALRNLIELASIELVGRLNKMPYWSCLGIDSELQDVKDEVSDWYYSLESNNELVIYLQAQLRNRGYYNGPLNNQSDARLDKAVLAYKRDLSAKDPEYVKKIEMTLGTEADEKFFTALLNRPIKLPRSATTVSHAGESSGGMASTQKTDSVVESSTGKTIPATSAAAALAASNATASIADDSSVSVKPKLGVTVEKPSNINITGSEQSGTKVKNANKLNFIIKSQQDAYLYCYYADDENKIMRIYPNRFRKDSFISANEEIQIPGAMPFQIASSSKGVTEHMSCFTTERDILSDLPAHLKVTDFVKLSVSSLDEVKKTVSRIAETGVSEFTFDIKVQ